jgi:NAD(P)-dependent dehydrogenase (short-subunit alcohol dehydrogenase family)
MNADTHRLDSLVAVVTGGAQGIGAETARLFAERGAEAVVLIDRNAQGNRDVAVEVEALGASALAITADISVEADVDRAVSDVESRYGRCDVLINCAGILAFSPLEETAYDEWLETMDSNVNGHFLCTRGFGRLMLQQGKGAIVNVTSLAGAWPKAGGGAYSASKAAQAILAKQVAVEWGPRGVRANVVSPGMVETAMAGDLYVHDEIRARREALVPVGRIGNTRDVAELIAFLSSDASAYVSGQEIHIDGGFSEMIVRMLPHPGVVEDLARRGS